MSVVQAVVLAAAEENALPVSSVVYPLIALGFFALIAAVTWSYRDVARRHPDRSARDSSHGSGH